MMREKQGSAILKKIKSMQDVDGFRDLHWEGTFEEYLEFVRQDTNVARSAFQRLYDMIVSHGYEEYTHHRETLIHYYFFDDPFENGKDAVFVGACNSKGISFSSADIKYGVILSGEGFVINKDVLRMLDERFEHIESRVADGLF